MQDKDMAKNKIELLQVLRAYGAASVFISHFFGDYSTGFIKMGGQLGVAIFFVISGYLLIITTSKGIEHFLVKRMIRILPLYYLATICLIIAGSIKPEWLHTSVINRESIVKAFLLLPNRISDGNGGNLIQPILPVAWTLYFEVFIYIVYFLAYKIRKNNYQAGKLVVLMILGLNIAKQISGTDNVYLGIYGSTVMLYFAVGMLVAMYVPQSERTGKRNLPVVLLGLFVFLAGEQIYGNVTYEKIILVAIIFSLLIRFAAGYSFPPAALWMGNISYSFYLVHYFVIKFTARILGFEHTGNLGVMSLALVLCSLVTIGVSWLSWKLVEQRLGNYLSSKLI